MSVDTHKTSIHPTAIVSSEAELGAGVTVGPYSIMDWRWWAAWLSIMVARMILLNLSK